MGGAILQLVANNGAHQNIWIDGDPQITFFKKIYRRHTPFSIEHIALPITDIDFGKSGSVVIRPKGDLVHRMFFSFDIPYMAAAFLNLKTEDITNAVNESILSDQVFVANLRRYIGKDDIQVGETMNIIESTLKCYDSEEVIRLKILENLNTYKDPIGFSTVDLYNRNTDVFTIDNQLYDFVDFKINLADEWLKEKKNYAPIYNYLKFVYDSNKTNIQNTPVLNTNIITNILLYSSIFNNIIPNREILALFYIKHFNYSVVKEQTSNSLIETFNILMTNEYEQLILSRDLPLKSQLNNNYEYYQFLNSIFNVNPVQVINPDFYKNTTSTDTHTLLRKVSFSLDDQIQNLDLAQSEFYNYGRSYNYIINTYNTIINIFNSLATTTPIVVCKSFEFTQSPADIYNNFNSVPLKNTVNPTFIDPNFNFITESNKNEEIYPNKYVNEYLQLLTNQSYYLFNNIEQEMNTLFEFYKIPLFSKTSTLYFNNMPPLKNIYSYIVPTQGYQDNGSKRIANVFNLNIWFFYFFQYLDSFNEVNFTNYVTNNSLLSDMNSNEQLFMASIIKLLKLNIEFYMNEISYMLNNLYSKCPSPNPQDSMKNYVPMSFGSNMNGVNISSDLLGITMLFYRNHTQTIIEIFYFMYHFIDTISINQINNYLGINILPILPSRMNPIREIVRLLYYSMFQYFMNIYDSFQFETPANFSMNDYNSNDVILIKQYVNYFFKNDYLPGLQTNETQISLVNVINQMEFYFVSEMINMRETEKFYYNTVFNDKIITDQVGVTTAMMINMIKKFFNSIGDEIVLTKIPCSDRTRNYYDVLYQPNDLYYSTFNIDRYMGLQYDQTGYESRDYGIVVPPIDQPIPLPPTDPYGIDPTYYNIPSETLPVYWNGQTKNIHNTKNDSNEYQLFPIDYFRIKHSLLHLPNIIIPSNVIYIDQYQNDILKVINLTEQLIKTFPILNTDILNIVYPTLESIKNVTNPTALYTTYLRIYNLGNNPTLVDMLNAYINNLIDADLLIECLNGLNEMFMDIHNGVQIQINQQSIPYTYDMITQNNLYTYNDLINTVDINVNIIDKVILARDNFISEYFYYVKYEKSIVDIQNMNIIGSSTQAKSFYFMNTGQITYDILNQTNYNNIDLSPLQRSSTLIFFYPNAFPLQVNDVVAMVDQLDDFSYNIASTLLSIISPNTAPRYTIKDLFDIINITFRSIKQSYAYTIENGFFDFVYDRLQFYQPSLLNKILLFNEIYDYFKKIPRDSLMTNIDAINVANMVVKYGINFDDYYNYILTEILPKFNEEITNPINNFSFQRDVLIGAKLNSELDYFFIRWVINDINVERYTLFQTYIIDNIFSVINPNENTSLLLFFSLIRNNDFAYVYIFYEYVLKNRLQLGDVTNPITEMDKNNLLIDQDIISLYYQSFYSLSDPLEYFMDVIWDWTMMLCNRNPFIVSNDFGYSNRPTVTINQIHLETILNMIEKNIQINNDIAILQNQFLKLKQDKLDKLKINRYFKRKCAGLAPEKQCINEIAMGDIFVVNDEYTNSSDYYFEILKERQEIISFVKDVCCRGIVLIQTQRKEIIGLQNSLCNIFYRNKRAKMAWIKKLAHFLIKEITIRNDDQILDAHPSDWLEIFHEISKADGSDYGYNKMIGNREDLIIYDDQLKNAYNIILPFVFYCNRNIMSALPLNASINTTYVITITLRKLDEVTYKEQYSEFIDPTLYNHLDNPDVKPFIPSICNSQLITEYIYLTTEERKIFVTNLLEYLMEELQDDGGFNVNDENLVPIYKIGTTKKENIKIVNGRKTKETVYDQAKGLYIDKEELANIIETEDIEIPCPTCEKSKLDLSTLPIPLIKRNDMVPEKYVDKTGVPKLMMVNKPLSDLDPNLDPYVHQKRISYKYYFSNPSELLTMVIKMDIHTQPSVRENEKYYFYGEYQWDNYGLYSYYDLTAIYDAKKKYYDDLQIKLNNPNDPTYGFITVINRLILLNKNETNEYTITLHRIKEAYLQYTGVFIDYGKIIRLKENLMYMKLNYDIYQLDFLLQLVNDVYEQLNISPVPSNEVIIYTYSTIINNFNVDSFTITYDQFQEGIFLLLQNQIQINLITSSKVCSSIGYVYTNYNESQINLLISIIIEFFDVNVITYNFTNFMDYFYNLYELNYDALPQLLNMLIKINDAIKLLTQKEIISLDNYLIQDLFYKNIVYQIVPIINIVDYSSYDDYLTLIPFKLLNQITKDMNKEENNIINNTKVELIDYQKNIKLNQKINPLVSGNLTFNSYDLMPANSEGILWSDVESYLYLLHTPSTGINLHSWSQFPLLSQGFGSANLTRIDEFKGVYDLHPLIGTKYPATIKTIILSINLLRVMSGLTGKAWEFGSFKN